MRESGFARIRPHLLPVLLLVAVTVAVYARSLGHEFMANWDDHLYVTENEAVRGVTLEHLRAAFTRFFVGNYAPLQIVSYMVDYTLWGLRPFGFILGNILFHTANGVLYYAFVASVTKRRSWAFLAAFIFLTHPVQVESVVWISQRKSVLAMFFFLLAFGLYAAYREKAGQRRRLWWYAASLLAFDCALLSKSVAVILPAVLVLYDLCLGENRSWREYLLDKLPYLAAAAAATVVALISQQPEFMGGRIDPSWGQEESLLLTMLAVCVRYLTLLCWPVNLSASYDLPLKTGIDAEVLGAMAVLAGVAGLGYWLCRRQRRMFFWFALFFLGLAPVAQVVPLVTLMNDRYLYFPLLGAATLLPGAVFLATAALPAVGRRLAVGLLVLLLVPLPLLASARTEVWHNSVALWMDNARKNPHSNKTWLPLAQAYQKEGNLEAALVYYMKVLSAYPTNRVALNNLGVLFMEKGELPRAHDCLVSLVKCHPDYAIGHCNLGDYYVRTCELRRAEEAYARAVRIDPGYVKALTALAKVQSGLHEAEEARLTYRSIAALNGCSADLEYAMTCLEAAHGRPDQALRHLEASVRRGYDDVACLMNEPELAALRTLPGFRRLVATVAATAAR
ncbi:MAG TPA: hypothetical protein VIU40_12680 [Geobacteraceae bacterium]